MKAFLLLALAAGLAAALAGCQTPVTASQACLAAETGALVASDLAGGGARKTAKTTQKATADLCAGLARAAAK